MKPHLNEEFWSAIYNKAFPNLVNMMACPGDYASQRMGIDRVLLLSNGKVLKIDEKKREKEYNDILLEYLSNDQTNAPGWIEKDLAIDYLAYAFIQSRRCYLFPWAILRRAWMDNRQDWKQKVSDHTGTQMRLTPQYSVAVPHQHALTARNRASR